MNKLQLTVCQLPTILTPAANAAGAGNPSHQTDRRMSYKVFTLEDTVMLSWKKACAITTQSSPAISCAASRGLFGSNYVFWEDLEGAARRSRCSAWLRVLGGCFGSQHCGVAGALRSFGLGRLGRRGGSLLGRSSVDAVIWPFTRDSVAARATRSESEFGPTSRDRRRCSSAEQSFPEYLAFDPPDRHRGDRAVRRQPL
jgi:hypothetical protein